MLTHRLMTGNRFLSTMDVRNYAQFCSVYLKCMSFAESEASFDGIGYVFFRPLASPFCHGLALPLVHLKTWRSSERENPKRCQIGSCRPFGMPFKGAWQIQKVKVKQTLSKTDGLPLTNPEEDGYACELGSPKTLD